MIKGPIKLLRQGCDMWKWLRSLFGIETYEEGVERQRKSGKLDLIEENGWVKVEAEETSGGNAATVN